MEIVGLDHVQLAIPPDGLDLARAFYGGVLGFAEEARSAIDAQGSAPRRSPGLWYRAPRTVVHLGTEHPFTPARKAHAAFLVTDLAAARAELEAAGFTTKDADGPRFHVFDPFGNRLELLQAGAGFSER